MATTWKRLFGPALLTGAAATKYTAPAAGAIIRYIRFMNEDTSARTVTFSVGADAAGTRMWDTVSIPAQSAHESFAIIPLTNGETIQAFADVTNKVTLTISGVDLT